MICERSRRFSSRYQFWYFRYDTGAPFLGSAARLRQQLATIHQVYDPARCNPNMSRIVLIGHSMGGLVAQLQVTYSGDTVWQAAATQPFNTIVTDPATRSGFGGGVFLSAVAGCDARGLHRDAASRIERCNAVCRALSSAMVEERPVCGGAARAVGAGQSGCISRRSAAADSDECRFA